MLVYNPLRHDARVVRHATALAESGYLVRVIATSDGRAPAVERIGGVTVQRVEADSPPSRLARRLVAVRRRRSGAPGDASPGSVVSPQQLEGGAGARALRALLAAHLAASWLTFTRNAVSAGLAAPADLYVANDLDTLPAAVALARRGEARLLYDSHELYVEHVGPAGKTRARRMLQRGAEERLIRRTDAVITVNQSIAEELERRYGIARPAVVMNVPSHERGTVRPVDLRAEIDLPPERRIALYLGGVSPDRGIEQLVDAARRLGDVALVLMGPVDAGYRRSLESRSDGSARFAAPVPAHEVVRFAAGADVGIVPYRNTCLNNYLSLPNKLFEYLAAGLPVVASDFPELRRVVVDHGVGETFDPEDAADIARAIRLVLDDPDRHRELRHRARQAAEVYSWEGERPKLLSVVERLTPAQRRADRAGAPPTRAGNSSSATSRTRARSPGRSQST
jgi:glycosyltransferase involved in cell wall biosynthesis